MYVTKKNDNDSVRTILLKTIARQYVAHRKYKRSSFSSVKRENRKRNGTQINETLLDHTSDYCERNVCPLLYFVGYACLIEFSMNLFVHRIIHNLAIISPLRFRLCNLISKLPFIESMQVYCQVPDAKSEKSKTEQNKQKKNRKMTNKKGREKLLTVIKRTPYVNRRRLRPNGRDKRRRIL